MQIAVDITPKAQQRFVTLGANQESFIRVAVVPGGCSGMTYKAELDDELRAGDITIFEDEGLRIITDQQSSQYLNGLTIDYSDDLIGAGFRFNNPFAQKSCGCGSSFAI